MRHIQLKSLIKAIYSGEIGKKDKQRLDNAHQIVSAKPKSQRQKYIEQNGSGKWSPIKKRMVSKLGNKCWYTEAVLVGADPTIDHYRPKKDYWWLAFDVENFRVACQYSNTKRHDDVRGSVGGKGDNFPLLSPGKRAKKRSELRKERPVILDPCKKQDCELIVFEADGRPIINPKYSADPIAVRRVEESKILLNLDHSAFNSQREQIRLTIEKEVRIHEKLNINDPDRAVIQEQLSAMISSKAPFSSAARHYLRYYQYLPWVDDLLKR